MGIPFFGDKPTKRDQTSLFGDDEADAVVSEDQTETVKEKDPVLSYTVLSYPILDAIQSADTKVPETKVPETIVERGQAKASGRSGLFGGVDDMFGEDESE